MAAISVLYSQAAQAQTSNSASSVRVGVQGGLTRTTVVGQDVAGMSSRNSYAVGLTVTMPATQMFEIGSELDYVSKGANTADNTGSLALNYVQIPVLARVNLTVPRSITPYLIAGPAIAFRSGCRIEGTNGGVTVNTSCAAGGLNTQSMDFGVIAGGGLSLTQGSYRATLGTRYDYGLTNLVSDASVTAAKNRTWSFLVGVELPVSR